jgi:hypothetical protein
MKGSKSSSERNTRVTLNTTPLYPSLGEDGDKDVRWQAFIRKTKLINAPYSFEEVMGRCKLFFEPFTASIIEQRVFIRNWITQNHGGDLPSCDRLVYKYDC